MDCFRSSIGCARRQGAMFAIAVVMSAIVSAAVFAPLRTAHAETMMVPATFADVAEKASPAVVNISTVKKTKTDSERTPFRDKRFENDPFREFFDRFFEERTPRRPEKERSLGSGFIIDSSGLIITNNHVIEDADDILVRMSDDKEYHARVMGRDEKTDIALIKIKGGGVFPFLPLGDSRKMRIGDWVVAIGNPFGLEHTVTVGILSARGRAIGAGPYDDFLQTDASINPGNSGGPLLNLDGEVIGINTAIVAGGNGIGFAIPTKMASKIINQLKDNGRVVRGWLGVMIQKVTPELAKSFKMDEAKGALVADVVKGGPAEKAGIERGDVIVEFNGIPINDWSELPGVVAETGVGAEVDVTVIRDGRRKTYKAKIAELKDGDAESIQASSGALGMGVEEITPELAEKLGLEEPGGVVITGITGDGPASESGLKVGDVVIQINRMDVKTLSDYNKLVSDIQEGETVLLLIRRGGNTLFFTLEIE